MTQCDVVLLVATDSDFEAVALARHGVALVGFWADWSGACHVMTPVIRGVARDLAGRVRVALVDVDRLPHLMARYGVESVPTVVLFRDGAPVGRVLGTMPRTTLMARVESLLRTGAAEPE